MALLAVVVVIRDETEKRADSRTDEHSVQDRVASPRCLCGALRLPDGVSGAKRRARPVPANEVLETAVDHDRRVRWS
jgi:hypothetical protein